MHVLRHHHIAEKAKSHLSANSDKFFRENVPRAHRIQKRQPPIATEGNKMQLTFAVVALRSRWHELTHTRKRQPQAPGSNYEPGAPSATLSFPPICRSVILLTILMSKNVNSSIPSHPPRELL